MKSFFPFFQKKDDARVLNEREFFASLHSTKLSQQEKELIKDKLRQFVTNTSHDQKGVSLWSAFMPQRAWVATLIIVALFLPGSWGIVRASQSALPGDMLYFFKIQVNEPVVGVWQRVWNDPAQWERERAKRRVREAEQLVEKKQLTEERKMRINTLVGEHRAALERYSQETDDEFVAEINREAKRVKIISSGKGRGKYVLVEQNEYEDKTSQGEGDEDDDAQHEDNEKDDRSESSEASFHQEDERSGSESRKNNQLTEKKQATDQGSPSIRSGKNTAYEEDFSEEEENKSEERERASEDEEEREESEDDTDEDDEKDRDEEDEEDRSGTSGKDGE